MHGLPRMGGVKLFQFSEVLEATNGDSVAEDAEPESDWEGQSTRSTRSKVWAAQILGKSASTSLLLSQ